MLGLGRKCVVLPYGLSDETREALARAAQPSRVGVAAMLVAFIGAWVPTKGAWDWSEILLRTKARVPAARFRFLGTSGYADGRPQRVLSDLGRAAADWIEVVPYFTRDQLPGYLAGATIGAFPSHVEGFGIAVLEKLAAGLPTVVYDIPSLREVIAGVDPTWLVPLGAIDAFVDRIVALLGLDEDGHARLAALSRGGLPMALAGHRRPHRAGVSGPPGVLTTQTTASWRASSSREGLASRASRCRPVAVVDTRTRCVIRRIDSAVLCVQAGAHVKADNQMPQRGRRAIRTRSCRGG